MKRIVFFLSMLVMIAFLSSCSKDDECKTETIELKSLEDEYGCVNTKYEMELDLTNQFTIIKSQVDFDFFVTGSCMPPNIDFTTYDLIAGKQGLTSGNTSIDYAMVKECDPVRYSMTVTFNQNATTEAPNLTYHALAPKLEEGADLSITIEEKF
jgi:hypothetical protein